jgi:hypothetical protein
MGGMLLSKIRRREIKIRERKREREGVRRPPDKEGDYRTLVLTD